MSSPGHERLAEREESDESLPGAKPRRQGGAAGGKPPKRVLVWVENYVRRERLFSFGGAAGLLLFGLAALWLTWWVCFWILGFVWFSLLNDVVSLSHGGLIALTWFVMALLFVAHWTTDRAELEHLEFETGPGVRATVAVARLAGYGHLVAGLGPKYAASYVKILAVLCLIAPQSLTAAVKLARRGARIGQLDVDACARVLTVLLREDGRVPFADLGRSIAGIDWETLLPLLRDIDGVVFLFNDPAGLTLASHLREEIVGPR